VGRKFYISSVRYIFSLFVLIVLGLGIFVWWALGEKLPKFIQLEVMTEEGTLPAAPKEVIKVASYNIGHGQGVKENSWDYRDEKTTMQQMETVAAAIKKMDADVIMLQEVDLGSKRTHGIDQLKFIKQKTAYGYHACALVWKKNYVPFPFFPLRHQIGFVRAANCILSKYPLGNHESLIFDKPASHAWWLNIGYIDRGLQRVDIKIGEKKVALLNVHLEAWDIAAREKQILEVISYMDKIDIPLILGGDFNTVMPGTKKLSGFLDEPGADFSRDRTLNILLQKEPQLVIPKINAISNENPYEHFTFPANAPDRRLDYIFIRGKGISFKNFRVGFEAGVASDHLPVIAEIKIN
jgi:endonuclease/exonuclease/phosphatase family metal-dependent hydrolase